MKSIAKIIFTVSLLPLLFFGCSNEQRKEEAEKQITSKSDKEMKAFEKMGEDIDNTLSQIDTELKTAKGDVKEDLIKFKSDLQEQKSEFKDALEEIKRKRDRRTDALGRELEDKMDKVTKDVNKIRDDIADFIEPKEDKS